MRLPGATARRLHVSWFIAALCGGFLVGDGLALLNGVCGLTRPIWLGAAVLLILTSFVKRRVWMISLVVVAGVVLGLWRGTLQRVSLAGYAPFINYEITVRGRVAEDPTMAGSNELRLRLADVTIDDQRLPGQVWASVLGKIQDVKRSDNVIIFGKLKTGFGTFPASMSFAQLVDVERRPGADPPRELRDEFGEKLALATTEPETNLGMGILAGQKTALPADVSEAFRVAGLTHIVVASGYNLTILIRFARRLFARVSRLMALLGAGFLVLAFACVTGFSPSMTRASLVAGLSLLAWYYGRKFHPVVLILTVAAATVAINPMYLWGDAGWYLSFLSFVGVIILAPLIHEYFWGKEKKLVVPLRLKIWDKWRRRYFVKQNFVAPRPRQPSFNLRQIVIETMSAQIMTIPIIALMLGQFAPYGLLANLLVLPIVPFAMLLTFVAGLAGWLVPGAAAVLGWPAQKLLEYIIWVAENVADLPGAAHTVEFGIWWFIGAMAALLVVMIYLWRRTGHDFRNDNVVQ
jgi:competence protein ComEC